MKELEEINNGFMAKLGKNDDKELSPEEVVESTLKSIKAEQ